MDGILNAAFLQPACAKKAQEVNPEENVNENPDSQETNDPEGE